MWLKLSKEIGIVINRNVSKRLFTVLDFGWKLMLRNGHEVELYIWNRGEN